jgi:hypothetical protein
MSVLQHMQQHIASTASHKCSDLKRATAQGLHKRTSNLASLKNSLTPGSLSTSRNYSRSSSDLSRIGLQVQDSIKKQQKGLGGSHTNLFSAGESSSPGLSRRSDQGSKTKLTVDSAINYFAKNREASFDLGHLPSREARSPKNIPRLHVQEDNEHIEKQQTVVGLIRRTCSTLEHGIKVR